jgi:hypothetical protein
MTYLIFGGNERFLWIVQLHVRLCKGGRHGSDYGAVSRRTDHQRRARPSAQAVKTPHHSAYMISVAVIGNSPPVLFIVVLRL